MYNVYIYIYIYYVHIHYTAANAVGALGEGFSCMLYARIWVWHCITTQPVPNSDIFMYSCYVVDMENAPVASVNVQMVT